MLWLFLLFGCYTAIVYNLTDDNFHAVVKDSDPWFLEFYAPWCGHCKKFAPVFKEAAEHEKIVNKVHFGAIDATVNKGITDEYDVHSYPSIFFSHEGRKYRFRDERTLNGVVAYLERVTSPPVEKSTFNVVKADMYEIVFVLTNSDPEIKEIFTQLTYDYIDLNYVRFVIADGAGGGEKGLIRLEKGRETRTLEHALDKESMKKFIEDSNIPIIRRIRGYTQFRPIARSADNTFMFVISSEEEQEAAHTLLNGLVDSQDIDQEKFTFSIVHYGNLEVLLHQQLNLTINDAPLFVNYHDRSAGFVVQAAADLKVAHDLCIGIKNGEAEWIYVLPVYQRATRAIQTGMESIGKIGQLVVSALAFSLLFGLCWFLDSYCFPDNELHSDSRTKPAKKDEPKKER